MATGQKLLQTIELSYTTTNVSPSTMTSLAALDQEMCFIHVYDTSGQRFQLLDSDETPLLNIPAGGLTTKETLRLEKDEVLYIQSLGQTMTSGYLLISIFGG